jgi:hypothetical protein
MLACQHCGTNDGTVAGAHSNWAEHGKGKSIKASDQYVASLCFSCHRELDQGKDMTDEEKRAMWSRAHFKTFHALLGMGLWPVEIPFPEVEPEGVI